MAHLAVSAVRRQIAGGQLDPLYLIIGDDEAEKASLAAAFADVVEPELRVFNVERLYAGEVTALDVVTAARTLPLIVPRRIVILLQAEKLLAPKRESEAATRDLDTLEAYVRMPAEHATLVLVAGELDNRRRVALLLSKRATVVECGGVQDASEAAAWIRARAAREGVTIEPGAVALLAERAGADMARLRADTERVFLYAAGQGIVKRSDVAETVGPATSQDAWAVTAAIERGAVGPALRELALLLDTGVTPFMIVGQLAWLARTKLPAPRVKPALEALLRTDLDLKRSVGEPRVLLERLVVELCERPSGGPARSTRSG